MSLPISLLLSTRATKPDHRVNLTAQQRVQAHRLDHRFSGAQIFTSSGDRWGGVRFYRAAATNKFRNASPPKFNATTSAGGGSASLDKTFIVWGSNSTHGAK